MADTADPSRKMRRVAATSDIVAMRQRRKAGMSNTVFPIFSYDRLAHGVGRFYYM